jgi:nucleotidyltransferase substrate binding protein (TIGR01987 family)
MASSELKKLKESISELEHALTFVKKAESDPFYSSGISKSFEVCFEYTWKYLKQTLFNKGMEAYSPRDVIKVAGQIKLIDNVEQWLAFLKDRNLSVHDYLGIEEKDYLKTIKDFLTEVKKISADGSKS